MDISKKTLELAIKSLEYEADFYKVDERALSIWGDKVKEFCHKGAHRRKELLEAASELKAYRAKMEMTSC